MANNQREMKQRKGREEGETGGERERKERRGGGRERKGKEGRRCLPTDTFS